eukprot:IDg6598t1
MSPCPQLYTDIPLPIMVANSAAICNDLTIFLRCELTMRVAASWNIGGELKEGGSCRAKLTDSIRRAVAHLSFRDSIPTASPLSLRLSSFALPPLDFPLVETAKFNARGAGVPIRTRINPRHSYTIALKPCHAHADRSAFQRPSRACAVCECTNHDAPIYTCAAAASQQQ